MMRLLATCTGIGICSLMQGQTMTNASGSPVPGDVVVHYVGSGPLVDPGGPGVVWDMSGIEVDYEAEAIYESPVGTTWFADYPEATVVEPAYPSGYWYYLGSDTGFYLLGSGTDEYGTDPCSDPNLAIPYPLAYGDTWYDSYHCWSLTSPQFGSNTCEADGYGDLILPWGTVQNVLRTACTWEVSYLSGNDTITQVHEVVQFFKPGTHGGLLSGSETEAVTVHGIHEMTLGVDAAVQQALGMALHPNPATDRITVDYSCTGERMVGTVLDNTGHVVLRQSFGGRVGIGRQQVDVSMLRSGLYTLHLRDERGDQGSGRFMVR